LNKSFLFSDIDNYVNRTIINSLEITYYGGGEMPEKFKALASIMAWSLWIISWVIGLSTFVMGLVNGYLYGSEPAPMAIPAFFALSLAYGIGAVVVMILRKKME